MKTKIANSSECTHVFREWLKDNGMYVDFCMNLFHANSMTLSEYVYALWSAPSTFCILDTMVSGAFVFSEAFLSFFCCLVCCERFLEFLFKKQLYNFQLFFFTYERSGYSY